MNTNYTYASALILRLRLRIRLRYHTDLLLCNGHQYGLHVSYRRPELLRRDASLSEMAALRQVSGGAYHGGAGKEVLRTTHLKCHVQLVTGVKNQRYDRKAHFRVLLPHTMVNILNGRS